MKGGEGKKEKKKFEKVKLNADECLISRTFTSFLVIYTLPELRPIDLL